MEHKQGTSFIPKSPVRGAVKPKGVRKIYIFTYISFVFFFGTMLATAGTFFYNISINAQLNTQKERLSEERTLFNQSDLERIRELEKRMNIVASLVDKKVSLHSLFSSLEKTTVRVAQITGFEYKKGIDNSLGLALEFQTPDFNSALFQREIFASDSVLKGATLNKVTYTDGVSSGENGEILSQPQAVFNISKALSTSDIPYVPVQAPYFVAEENTTDQITELEAASSTVDTSEEIGDINNQL